MNNKKRKRSQAAPRRRRPDLEKTPVPRDQPKPAEFRHRANDHRDATLERVTFKTSRELDFFSKDELTAQTGHSVREFPYVFLKEGTDNALDGCEDRDIAPEVIITADAAGLTVADNGPGISEETIAGALDFKVRASSRDHYISPTRGAQGNALMTLVAMPFVIDRDHGRLCITSHGIRHEIACKVDAVSQRVVIHDHRTKVKERPGTELRIQWAEKRDDTGDIVWPFDEFFPNPEYFARSPAETVQSLARGYGLFNPHLTIKVNWFGQMIVNDTASDPEWQKWKPNKPTSPHWYTAQHLEKLVAAYITHDRDHGSDRTVAAFVAEFDGLTGNAKRKQLLGETGLGRVNLSDLATADGLRSDTIADLLEAMKRHTKPVKPDRLGIIGREHIQQRLESLGCDPDRIEYSKVARIDDGVPFVLESAFGWLGDGAADRRHIFAGANWSYGLKNPFRTFGESGEGLEALLNKQRAGADEPIVFVLHLAHPRIEFTDRGKSAIVVED